MGINSNRYRRDDHMIKIVGQNIRKYRKLKGLTIMQLSYKCEISTKQIGDYERGKVDTNITMLSILAKHLEIKPFLLLMEEE